MNKNKDKIFIVIEYGGQYEDSYEHVICAFDDYGSAKEYTDKMKKMYSSVNEDTFNEIERVLSIEEDKIYAKYFGYDVIQKPNIEDYENEINKFHEKTKFEIVENMFGIDKETYIKIKAKRDFDFCGYNIKEIELIHKNKEK